MSGIALVLAERGIRVTGSDLKRSRYSRALEEAGVPIAIGHAAENLGDPQVVVVSSAIPESNPELAEARRRGTEVWPRAKMLAHLAGERDTIAVAGTHGKTSTSSMVATMLSRMGLAPTFLIGGEVDGFDTNAVNGSGAHYVVEADESDGSFVHLDPKIAIITNVEADHLDHYGTLEAIEDVFCEFMARVAEDGVLVICGDDARLVELASSSDRRVVTYGFGDHCDVRCASLARDGVGTRFSVEVPGGMKVESLTRVPGEHMVANAAASLATAWVLGLDLAQAGAALAEFTGVRRRFDLIAEVGGVTIVDDYAHHPTEVLATLTASRPLGFERVLVLFQPHRYSRTQALAADFANAFGPSDRAVLMDVYSAGEAPIPGVSGKTVLDALLREHPRTQVAYLPHRADVVPYLASTVRSGDLVLTMGAGDVTTIGPELAEALRPRAARDVAPCH
ncbi:MAG: UDP-N-acetylmuramate--L-alanine ligase [Coriobacteriia bacterium]|nr:UDP-N-acetylmuramate--L-alanine ligase [Coriobacteriia bacterium]